MLDGLGRQTRLKKQDTCDKTQDKTKKFVLLTRQDKFFKQSCFCLVFLSCFFLIFYPFFSAAELFFLMIEAFFLSIGAFFHPTGPIFLSSGAIFLMIVAFFSQHRNHRSRESPTYSINYRKILEDAFKLNFLTKKNSIFSTKQDTCYKKKTRQVL